MFMVLCPRNSRSHFSDIFYQMYAVIFTQAGKMVCNLSNLFNLSAKKETQTALSSLIFLCRWEYNLGKGTYQPVLHSLWSAKSEFNGNIISKIPSSCDIPLVCEVLKKAEEPEIKLPTSTGPSKKQESSRKKSASALLTMPKPYYWLPYSHTGL